VGTHGTFLETMKARLSLAGYPELQRLTSRDSDDAAIALLDAWATVADVLTFYQERIANEGYLRTATERRSVLELARLVGYRLRPGVASTVYLAYTLDKGSPVTIAAGSRAQSVPGPGELPQSFETSDDLLARAEWNTLGVRKSEPQTPKAETLSSGGALHFAGISTNLKPNDPLLVDFGARQEVYRVMEVSPDATADRTKVVVQQWLPVAKTTATSVLKVIDRFSDVSEFSVSPAAQGTKRVLAILDDLKKSLTEESDPVVLGTLVGTELDAKLAEEEDAAVKSRSTRIAPWVKQIREELAAAAAPKMLASNEIAQGPCGGGAPPPPTTKLANLLPALLKPASVPPAGSLRLNRDITRAYSAESDIVPQLLSSLRPELAGTLYGTWKNVPVTPPPPVAVYALRARASAFGHNAPLKAITNDAGGVTGHEEWTLMRTSGGKRVEFQIDVQLRTRVTVPSIARENIIDVVYTITVAGGTGTATRPLADETFTINVPGLSAPVAATITLGDSNDIRMRFQIVQPKIIIDLSANTGTETFQATSSESDLISVITIASAKQTGALLEMTVKGTTTGAGEQPTEEPNAISLDATYPGIIPCGWIVIERPYPLATDSTHIDPTPLIISRVLTTGERSRSDYGIAAKGTRVGLEREWIAPELDSFEVIRGSAVFTQSEALPLAESPIERPVCGGELELDGLYDGLQSGRWVIVSGERADVTAQDAKETAGNTGAMVPGVPGRELAMIATVEQTFNPAIPGDRTHTVITLAADLAYCYRRDTMVIYGNVVKATHGETRIEVLGSGDGSKALQSFTLRQPPLTYVAAPTTSGVESTLKVRINDVLWHEAGSILDLGPKDHGYTTKTGDDNNVTVTFGDGRQGSRLPTGSENVRAVYRNGIGKGGNVRAEQITMLATRPLGVKEVINPLRASGGADRESRDQARSNAPLAVMALDRLVSVQDYADFARTFAGIGKASATRLTDGRHQLVHLTIAGTDDIPIDTTSDLYINLCRALLKYGDPYQPIRVEMRELLLVVISAWIKIHPDHEWEKVEPTIRAALLDALSFKRRALGEDVTRSEVIATIQNVPGVLYVNLDALDAMSEAAVTRSLSTGTDLAPGLLPRIPVRLAGEIVNSSAYAATIGTEAELPIFKKIGSPARLDGSPAFSRVSTGTIHPAQIAILSPDVPDTLILKVLPS
jgi:predicted phage baseplate assembly protein